MSSDSDYILAGDKIDLPTEYKSFGEYVFYNRKVQPKDKLYQINLDNGEEMTFENLFQLSLQVCQGLIERGLEVGDVVTLFGKNSNQLHASFLGILWACGVPHTMDTTATFVEANPLLTRIKPKWIISEYQCLEVASKCQKSLGDGVKLIVINSPQAAGCGVTRLEDILVDVDASEFSPRSCKSSADTSLILCSSGTTGIPKGVALSHRSMISEFHVFRTGFDFCSFEDTVIISSDMMWISAVINLAETFLWGCFRIICTSRDPELILKTIQDYKVKRIIMPPLLLKFIVSFPGIEKYNLSSLKCVITTGSVMGKSTLEALQSAFSSAVIAQLYGMTETSGVVTSRQAATDICSIGYPPPNVEMKIVDMDTGEALGPERSGELCIRSPLLFNTYVGNEEEARRTFDSDGWFHTGDVAHYSKEKLLYLTSRIKEIIKINDRQVSFVELENHISGIPGVVDVGVTGIFHDGGYHLMGLIVKAPNFNLTAETIIKNVEENFSEAKHLKAGVYFVDKIPRSVSKKIKRNDLQDKAREFFSPKT